ncbi:MAG: Uma2 family endonuclease [Chloroflexia bacterium]|nr:Uma2 family endonuclease [Chloroflexia bacterium]
MAKRATPRQFMSIEEYLAFERASLIKHEYVGGHLYAMVGVSPHSRIAGNIFVSLREAARSSSCRVHQSDMQVPVPDGPYYYPDVVVSRIDEPEDPYLEDEPCLIVEVLSPHTALTDRREKLIAYRKLPSLQTYLIVEQEGMLVERRFRDQDGRWHSEFINDGGVLVPCPPGTQFSLAEIYEGLQVRAAQEDCPHSPGTNAVLAQ